MIQLSAFAVRASGIRTADTGSQDLEKVRFRSSILRAFSYVVRGVRSLLAKPLSVKVVSAIWK